MEKRTKVIIWVIVIVVLVSVISLIIWAVVRKKGRRTSSPPSPTSPSSPPSPLSPLSSTQWIPQPNLTYVNGRIPTPGQGSADGNVVYLGTTNDANGCQTDCVNQPGCNAYTWHNADFGVYANQCYGVKDVSKETALPVSAFVSGHHISS